MSAYVISEVKVVEEPLFDRYRTLAAAAIEQYGGRYIIRGGPVTLVEGTRDLAKRFVIVEFPDMERAHAWYRSAEYAEALKIRAEALERTLVFVEGT